MTKRNAPQQSKLLYRLKHEFDPLVIKTVRKLENTERKLARFRNHLHFTLHCKHQGLTPNSLKLRTSAKGQAVDKVLQKAERALMSLRIGNTLNTIGILEGQKLDLEEKLFTELPNPVYLEVISWVTTAHKAEYTWCKIRQQAQSHKLKCSQQGIENQDKPLTCVDNSTVQSIQERWVVKSLPIL